MLDLLLNLFEFSGKQITIYLRIITIINVNVKALLEDNYLRQVANGSLDIASIILKIYLTFHNTMVVKYVFFCLLNITQQ